MWSRVVSALSSKESVPTESCMFTKWIEDLYSLQNFEILLKDIYQLSNQSIVTLVSAQNKT